jgi:hypothetical protein
MFRLILGFEAQYQIKQKAFFLLSIIFLALGFMQGSARHAPFKVDVNASYQISFSMMSTTMTCTLVIMFFAINGLLRDKRYDMEAIIHSTSIKKSIYFLSRFLGVYIFSLITLSMSLVGFYLGTLSLGIGSESVANFNLWHYLWSWVLFIIPNVFVFSAILFSIAILTKNTIAIYTSAIILYILYWVCSIYFNSPMLAPSSPSSPEAMVIGALADPFGIYAFFEQTEYWIPFQKNTQSISFSGYFMWNRIIWCVLAILLLLRTYKVFSFKK